MKKGNVLFLGNSGVGKTTLVNAIMETDSVTGFGTQGTTPRLEEHENDGIPFKIIDTIGFEPVKPFKTNRAVKEVKEWCKKAALDNNDETNINVICLCVDGTSSKLFPKTIDDFLKSIAIWETVPVIIVITKSYSLPDRKENIKMVKEAFKNRNREIRGIYPVVAAPYIINDDYYVEPQGIVELIEGINELLPEGIKAANSDINTYILGRKRFLSQGTIIGSTGLAVGVGLAPVPFPDAFLLAPIEKMLINSIAKIYGIERNDQYKNLLKKLVDEGTVGLAAKTLIQLLKVIPAINLPAIAINGVISGVIVAAVGEASVYIYEQIFLGKRTVDDVEWAMSIIETKLTGETVKKAESILKSLPKNASKTDISAAINKCFSSDK